MRYAPTPVRLKSGLHWVKIQSQIYRFNRRTRSLNDDVLFAAIVSIFAHIRAYAIRPYGFPVMQKQLYSHIMICAIVLPSKMSSQMGNPHLPGVNGTFAMGNQGLKSEQNTSPTCEMRTVFCAKRLSRLRWR